MATLIRGRQLAAVTRSPEAGEVIRLEPGDDPAAVAARLPAAARVEIHFPKFADGRGFSLARIVRGRLGYRGELRAVGAGVARDHLWSLAQCGFDAFELREGEDAGEALAAFEDFSVSYARRRT